MKISLKGLTPEQKQQVRTIVQLGQSIGGTEEIDNYLMSQLMNVYMPETDKIDDLASAYEITEDPTIKSELTNSLFKKLGINPEQKALDETLFKSFAEKYPIEQNDNKRAYENAQFQTMMQQSPEMLRQFYQGTPERNMSSPISAIFSGESEKEKRARLQSLLSQYQSNLPRQ